MCGRFALAAVPRLLLQMFGLHPPPLSPRRNISPGQPVMTLLREVDGPEPEWQTLEWGLVPGWARDREKFRPQINARVEGVSEKPFFRAAFRHRRCLIPADGFYEWRKEGKATRPFFFRPANPEDGVVMAGIWEDWTDGVEYKRTLAIITRPADAAMRDYHDRMPMLPPRDIWGRWLDPAMRGRELEELLAAPNEAVLEAVEVTDRSILGRSSA